MPFFVFPKGDKQARIRVFIPSQGETEKAKSLLTSNEAGALSTNLTMGTVISVFCACGKEDAYPLNALRARKAAIGGEDEEEPLDIPQISVCQPISNLLKFTAIYLNLLLSEIYLNNKSYLLEMIFRPFQKDFNI